MVVTSKRVVEAHRSLCTKLAREPVARSSGSEASGTGALGESAVAGSPGVCARGSSEPASLAAPKLGERLRLGFGVLGVSGPGWLASPTRTPAKLQRRFPRRSLAALRRCCCACVVDRLVVCGLSCVLLLLFWLRCASLDFGEDECGEEARSRRLCRSALRFRRPFLQAAAPLGLGTLQPPFALFALRLTSLLLPNCCRGFAAKPALLRATL